MTLLAALLFTGGKFLIGAYIGRSGIAAGFGAAGSLVVEEPGASAPSTRSQQLTSALAPASAST